jgi:hypothetical protein
MPFPEPAFLIRRAPPTPIVPALPSVVWPKEPVNLATFAAANGWSVYSGRWPAHFAGVSQSDLLRHVDHAELLCERGTRRIIGVISHDYSDHRDFSPLGTSLVVERLPQSWYSPNTTALLLRPTPSSRKVAQ